MDLSELLLIMGLYTKGRVSYKMTKGEDPYPIQPYPIQPYPIPDMILRGVSSVSAW